MQYLRRIFGTHDAWYTQLARDDRGMARAAAFVGDDRRSDFHDRLPIRVGDLGHQYLARLKCSDMLDVAYHAHRAGRDLGTHRGTFGDDVAFSLQDVFGKDVFVGG